MKILNSGLAYMTLDEVAESFDGVPPDLYRKLWSMMPESVPAQGEWPEPDSADRVARGVKKHWHKFTNTEQELLNKLAEEQS